MESTGAREERYGGNVDAISMSSATGGAALWALIPRRRYVIGAGLGPAPRGSTLRCERP